MNTHGVAGIVGMIRRSWAINRGNGADRTAVADGYVTSVSKIFVSGKNAKGVKLAGIGDVARVGDVGSAGRIDQRDEACRANGTRNGNAARVIDCHIAGYS